MPIRDTYAALIMENILKEILSEGEIPKASEINTRFDTFLQEHNVSEPLFVSDDYKVEALEASSTSKYNEANNTILQDLKVIYRHLFKTTNQSIEDFERWRREAEVLEARLQDLEERITDLLLIADDTEGYFNFFYDSFADTSKVDLVNSTAYVNISKSVVSIPTSTTGATKVSLDEIQPTKDVEFTVLSQNDLASIQSANQSALKNVVSDKGDYWQVRVVTTAAKPVSGELKIKLDAKKEISRIDMDLHMSNANSLIQITPMYSVDNYNYKQLPISNYTKSVNKKATFQFSPVEAQQIKFVMTKSGFDQTINNQYVYEFGVDQISLYNEQFTTSTSQSDGYDLVTKPLYVLDGNGAIEEFSKVTLEACEDVPTGTSIDYYVAASNEATLPIASGIWTEISPSNRSNPTKPTVVDFGDLDEVTISGVLSSYDKTETDARFVNPDKDFTIINAISAGVATELSAVASDQRYTFSNSGDRILDHCIASGVQIAKGTLEVWRNVNIVDTVDKVRGEIIGWGFDDTYYSTTVYVSNAQGTTINWGGSAVVIDGIARTGTYNVPAGNHKIQVHKDNWKEVSVSNAANLIDLKAADSLYPYNHKYLVEGFNYPACYPTADEKVYHGFDIVGEYLMKEVSVFDFIHNVASDDYSKYAIDKDVPDSSGTISGGSAAREAMRVILVKIDASQSDFSKERFILKFNSANTLYKYLRLKAVLKTTEDAITPSLDSYKIKIAS